MIKSYNYKNNKLSVDLKKSVSFEKYYKITKIKLVSKMMY